VDYSAATSVPASLANGQIVEAKGALTTSGALRATRVDAQAGLGAATNDKGEIEGLVTRFASANDFDVNGQAVSTNSSTTFILNGQTLGANARVEVEGAFSASGVLNATKVSIEAENNSRVYGVVTSTSPLQAWGGGVGANISTSAGTELEDKSSAAVRPFHVSDLRVGDFVQVRGVESTPGTLNATILERLNADTHVEIEGIARNINSPSFTVLGLVLTTNATMTFEDASGGSITSTQFFATLAAGSHAVDVRGRLQSGVVTLETAQIGD
jgi:hypothetical protein